MADFFVDPDPTLDTGKPVEKVLSNQTAAPPSSKVAALFEHMGRLLDKSFVEQTRAVFQFDLKGIWPSQFTLSLIEMYNWSIHGLILALASLCEASDIVCYVSQG